MKDRNAGSNELLENAQPTTLQRNTAAEPLELVRAFKNRDIETKPNCADCARQTGGPGSNDANSWFYHGFALNAYVPQSATVRLGSRTISDFPSSGCDLHAGGDSSADAFTAAARQERHTITMVKNITHYCEQIWYVLVCSSSRS